MYQHILVPIDGSATSEHGLREAIRLAADQKARLRLLTVTNDFPLLVELSSIANFEASMATLRDRGHRLLSSAARLARKVHVETETVLREMVQGRIADIVIEEADRHGCDLIVMGTHGRRGIRRMAVGSDAELVVRMSTVPVLLVRAPQAEGQEAGTAKAHVRPIDLRKLAGEGAKSTDPASSKPRKSRRASSTPMPR
jgi:nucleotide-binding universal stress UspA family protein